MAQPPENSPEDNIGHEVSRFVHGLIQPPENRPEDNIGHAINHDWLLLWSGKVRPERGREILWAGFVPSRLKEIRSGWFPDTRSGATCQTSGVRQD